MVTDDERQAFSKRLNDVLDDAGFAAKGNGRQLSLGKEMGVSQKGARKWLEGEAIPETTRLIDIATRFGVSFEWLATGRGAKALSRGESDANPRNSKADYPPEVHKIIAKCMSLLQKGYPAASLEKASGIFDLLFEIQKAQVPVSPGMDNSSAVAKSPSLQKIKEAGGRAPSGVSREDNHGKTGTTGQ